MNTNSSNDRGNVPLNFNEIEDIKILKAYNFVFNHF